MIDLHNHILPGVDDGATDVAESLAIARQFVSEGVKSIVATPHLDPENGRGIYAPRVRELTAELNAAIAASGLVLKIEPGQEVYLTPDLPDLCRNDIVLRLGAGNALLLELSLTTEKRPLFLEDTLFRLQVDGIQPILAHPERYVYVRRDSSSLDELVRAGVVLQLTAPSLLGQYGPQIRRMAERLLRRGVYALAASDRHHPGPERSLAVLHDHIVRLTSMETADLLLCTNPGRILSGTPVEQPDIIGMGQRSFLRRLFGDD